MRVSFRYMIAGSVAATAFLLGAGAFADNYANRTNSGCGGCGSPPPPPSCHSCGPETPTITNNVVNRINVGAPTINNYVRTGDHNINIGGPNVNIGGPKITNNYNFGSSDCCGSGGHGGGGGHGNGGGNQNQGQGQGQGQEQGQGQNQNQGQGQEQNSNNTNNNTANGGGGGQGGAGGVGQGGGGGTGTGGNSSATGGNSSSSSDSSANNNASNVNNPIFNIEVNIDSGGTPGTPGEGGGSVDVDINNGNTNNNTNNNSQNQNQNQSGGGNGTPGNGGGNVSVINSNTANSYAYATANSASAASGAASAYARSLSNGSGFATGGGGSFYAPAGIQAQGQINMCVDQEQLVTKTRLIEAMVMIQAVCIDDRGAPHPASRLDDAERVATVFSGELFRCVAGTYMQVTIGSESGDFNGGRTITCARGEALWHEAATGDLSCRPQTPERDCFERSLLRKYGPGAKVLMTRREESYQEVEIMQCVSTAGLYLSGGVGGY